MRRPIVNFLPLVLAVSTPNNVHHSTEVTKTLPKKSLNSTESKGALAAWFQCLCWYKEDNAVTVRLKSVALMVCIEVILKLLEGLLDWFVVLGRLASAWRNKWVRSFIQKSS